MKTVLLCDKRNLTNTNALKLKKAQREHINTYQKEQKELLQGQINKIRNLIEDRQSQITWPTVKVVYKKKSTSGSKLKAANQEE